MSSQLTPIDMAKFIAAKQATEYVEDGMNVGLGSGSTAAWFIQCLGEMVRDEGLKIKGVPTSSQTAELAREVGIEIVSLEQVKWLDLTVDGTDEYDRNLNLIKGGGGAHLREKIVATASERMIVIADATKKVDTLGAFPLPVEVVPFGLAATKGLIEETLVGMDVLGRDIKQRMHGDRPFVTDGGNLILDLHLRHIGNARLLGFILNQVPGVVEHGLFIDICDMVIVGHGDGKVTVRDITNDTSEVVQYDVRDDDNIFADIAE
ncbi:MAG: ribose-5-phosphate isomerase RpiA [Yoonia sp.]|uniref:ribose-5-phosphate isomerase RpiA n=1 Tax=Yoonia sp. TaxID=2212373 RepID=UPI003EF999C8